jgi:hypothetical protein
MATLSLRTRYPDLFPQGRGGGGGDIGGKSKKKKKKKGSAAGKWRFGTIYKKKLSGRTNRNELTLFTNEAKNVQKDGKSYLVVPGVPVREQVMNTYLLPASEIHPQDWEGTPISIRHAKKNNGSVQVENPDVPIIGYISNNSWDEQNKRMLAEYWIDEATAMKYPEGQVIISAIKNGKILETSTAYWADEDYTPGTHNGKEYKTIHRNPKRDHVAVFPDNQLGACSIEDGCGVNRNMKQNGEGCGCGCQGMAQNESDYPDYKPNHLPTMMLIGYAMNKGSRTQTELDSAKAYVEEKGITKPIWVQCDNGKYKILDGNHRVYLADELGIEQVPVRVVNGDLMELDPEAVYREWLNSQDQGYLK